MFSIRLVLRVLLLLAFGLSLRAHAEEPSAAGLWQGTIEMPDVSLAVRLDLAGGSGHPWSGSIDIPAQMLRGAQLESLTVEDGELAFFLADLPGQPVCEGTVSPDGESIEGYFSQGAHSFPLRLQRVEGGIAPDEVPLRGLPGSGLTGHWFGALRAGPQELRLAIHVERDEEGQLAGFLDVLDQGVKDVRIPQLRDTGDGLRFAIGAIQLAFDGTLAADGSELRGTWKMGQQLLPLVLKRVAEAPRLVRPQEPCGPFPYDVRDVRFTNVEDGVVLAGTLTLPPGKGPHPAAVLLSGSGPQDRDETVQGHRPFLVLADHLTRQGIAVLRFDNRGVAQSEGNFGTATHEDFAADALAAFEYLRRHEAIDPERVGLVAHSEGGAHAPLVALEAPEVAYIVSLAGVGVPIEQVLQQQQEDLRRLSGVAHLTADGERTLSRRMFQLLREEGATPAVRARVRSLMQEALAAYSEEQREALRLSEGMIEQQLQMLFSPWFVKLLAYDPRPVLEQVRCPVLAINGTKDVQVSAEMNLAGFQSALNAGGNPDVTIVELPGLNHLFQRAITGGIEEYARIDETFNPQALQLVSDWISKRTGL